MNLHTVVLWLGLVIAVLGVAGSALSATHRVPLDFATINAGLDASSAGDTVLVAPGVYTDFEVRVVGGGTRTSCAYLVDGVVLRSEGGPDVTTIDMQGMGSPQPNVILGTFLPSESTVVEGFRITGQPAGRVAVFINESGKVTFRDCVFVDLDGGIGTAAALNARETDADILGCEFRNCVGGSSGGIFQNQARLLVRDSRFVDCERAISADGEVGVPGQELIVENSIFQRCRPTSGSGGAIAAANYQVGVRIAGCLFEENEGENSGGAVVVVGASLATVEDCVFWKNRTTSGGSSGGALGIGGPGAVLRSTFWGNSAGQSGTAGTISLAFGATELSNNVIAGSGPGVGVRVVQGATVSGGCNVYWDNPDGNTLGFDLDPTDREVDPAFCNPAAGDLTVASDSPCLPKNSGGCGLIGALGEGCRTISVQSESWSKIKEGYRVR